MIYFSNNLKFLRTRAGLNQSELASRIGVKPNTISNYENGVSEPDFKIMDYLIKIFGVNLTDLLYQNFSENAQVDAQVNAQVDSKKTVKNSNTYKPPDSSNEPVGQYFCDQCKRKQEIIDAQKELIDLLKDQISALKYKLNDTDQTDKNGQKRKAS